jgi:hypothetical protein
MNYQRLPRERSNATFCDPVSQPMRQDKMALYC